MALEVQRRVLELVELALRRKVASSLTPDWLYRPGRDEIGAAWRTVRLIYRRLTDGMELPDVMPALERRAIDGILGGRGLPYRVVEVDESQHFNEFRLLTLRLYPRSAPAAFPVRAWIAESKRHVASAGGGWGKPKPPLFPMFGGRHRQRAFRDALADLLPPLHGYAPTLRVAEFEVQRWMYDRDATSRMRALLEARLTATPEGTR